MKPACALFKIDIVNFVLPNLKEYIQQLVLNFTSDVKFHTKAFCNVYLKRRVQSVVQTEDISNEKTFTAFEVVEVCVRNCTTAILIWHGEYIVHSNMLSFYIVYFYKQ